MASPNIRVGGTWRTVSQMHIRVGGTWQLVKSGWIRVGGVWQRFLSAVTNPFAAYDVWADSAPGFAATATFTLNTDGTVTASFVDGDGGSTIGSASWFTPTTAGIGSSYWVRYTVTSGTATTNGASSFTQLNAARSITKSASAGTASCTFTIEIATDSGGTNIVLTSTGNVVRYTHT